MNRRDFLEGMLAAGSLAFINQNSYGANIGAGSSDRLGQRLPLRDFGKTGEKITQLGVGGWHIGNASDEKLAEEIIETALAEGVRFFDTAPSYQDGRSEHRYGKFLTPKYREDVFLLTKTKARTAAEATAELESSLTRMKTDYIDAYLMHAITSDDDPERRVEAGVYDAFIKAKEQGKIRYLGFSGHLLTSANLKILELLGDQVDVSLMPINIVDPSDDDSFIEKVLPKLIDLGAAPLAMKTAAYGNFFNKKVRVSKNDNSKIIPDKVSMKEAFEFVLSLPISSWVSGMDNPEQVVQNAKIAREFKGLELEERKDIVSRVYAYRNNSDVEGYRRWP